MRVVAIRRGREWITDVDGDALCTPGDVLFLRGSPAGIDRLRELAAAPPWEPPTPPEDGTLTDLDRAVDVLVEMKNISETAVGLAYSALVLRDQGLAAEVRHLEDRLDEMKDRLELWVLRAAGTLVGNGEGDPAPLRGLLHLSQAAEDLGDQAQHMVWLVEQKEELHPILALALGESDDVVVRVPVGAGSRADGVTLGEPPPRHRARLPRARHPARRPLRLPPGRRRALLAGDELIASGPDEGHPMLAELLGWRLDEDEETGEQELVPLRRNWSAAVVVVPGGLLLASASGRSAFGWGGAFGAGAHLVCARLYAGPRLACCASAQGALRASEPPSRRADAASMLAGPARSASSS